MPAQFTLPPDTRAPGSPDPANDMNGVVDTLIASGAPGNVLNAAYAGGADPTGSADSAPAFQAAINALPSGGGAVYVPPGTYTLSTALTPVSGMRLHGSSYQSTIIQSSTSSLFLMDPGSQLDVVEIDHLSLIVTGAFPVFSKMWITRSSVHHCYLQAHNAGAAIWYSNSGTGYMAECRFYENREQVWGATRTVPAWYLNANNTGTLFQVNDNHWHDNVCFDNDKDTSQYWYQVIYSGAFTGVTNNANTFSDIVFEFPTGGMVRLESCSYTSLVRLTSEDFASSAVGNQQISVVKNASGGKSQNTTIRDYTRRGGSVAITDIQLDSNCVGTEIDSPALTGASGGSVLTIDLGNSGGNTLVAIPASAIVLNQVLNTFTDISLQPISADVPLQPTGATAATIPRRHANGNFTLASGTLQVAAINLPACLPVSNLTFVVNTTAEAGGSHGWYVLLDKNLKVVAVSADQTGATFWGSTGTAVTLALTGSYTTTYSGLFYAGICVVASTMPSFVVATAAVVNAVAALSPVLCGSSSTGQTTPPAIGATMAGISVAGGSCFYAYTS